MRRRCSSLFALHSQLRITGSPFANGSITWQQGTDHTILASAVYRHYLLCSGRLAGAQVIEKAYKKLRLDALVIQQGRLTETTKGVNKDDLLSMVRYGAEMVFNNTVRVLEAFRGQCQLKSRSALLQNCANEDHVKWCRCIMGAYAHTLAILHTNTRHEMYGMVQMRPLRSDAGRPAHMHEDLLKWLHFCTLQAGTVTDEDIDAIIEKGERDTEQLNQKLQVRPAGFFFCTEQLRAMCHKVRNMLACASA